MPKCYNRFFSSNSKLATCSFSNQKSKKLIIRLKNTYIYVLLKTQFQVQIHPSPIIFLPGESVVKWGLKEVKNIEGLQSRSCIQELLVPQLLPRLAKMLMMSIKAQEVAMLADYCWKYEVCNNLNSRLKSPCSNPHKWCAPICTTPSWNSGTDFLKNSAPTDLFNSFGTDL